MAKRRLDGFGFTIDDQLVEIGGSFAEGLLEHRAMQCGHALLADGMSSPENAAI
ncbi:hypothetical protein FHT72_003450 [Rhizobium sp. BK077]|jgi:hypothetical protein|nr:hypothetical protein [Rhizobium sp. BK112]MBB3368961.1 hypothetical protein [Rhizobium sp. BK077]MBB4179659.1 hypothetical protein [Rhizobium sp. BK109]MBB4250988.1 hypothetical protein [Rhizobium sp. BK008]